MEKTLGLAPAEHEHVAAVPAAVSPAVAVEDEAVATAEHLTAAASAAVAVVVAAAAELSVIERSAASPGYHSLSAAEFAAESAAESVFPAVSAVLTAPGVTESVADIAELAANSSVLEHLCPVAPAVTAQAS